MLILISDAFDDVLPKKLMAYGDVTDDKERLPEAEVVLVRSKTKCTKEWIDAASNCKLIIRGGVGLDNIDIPYAREKGILVLNTAEASTTAVAELAFSMMIALPNHTVKAHNSMAERKWLKKELKRTELHGKTLAILGMGRIGTALAVRARAFRMKILAWHPDVYFSDFAEIIPNLDDCLKAADYFSLHMPLLDSTRGLINKDKLALCKPTAYFVNTGRGQCVNEQDMADALKAGTIAGYATDVWSSDPPDDSPLFSAPNTLFAPHIGASTKENMIRIGIIAEQIISDYSKGNLH